MNCFNSLKIGMGFNIRVVMPTKANINNPSVPSFKAIPFNVSFKAVLSKRSPSLLFISAGVLQT